MKLFLKLIVWKTQKNVCISSYVAQKCFTRPRSKGASWRSCLGRLLQGDGSYPFSTLLCLYKRGDPKNPWAWLRPTTLRRVRHCLLQGSSFCQHVPYTLLIKSHLHHYPTVGFLKLNNLTWIVLSSFNNSTVLGPGTAVLILGWWGSDKTVAIWRASVKKSRNYYFKKSSNLLMSNYFTWVILSRWNGSQVIWRHQIFPFLHPAGEQSGINQRKFVKICLTSLPHYFFRLISLRLVFIKNKWSRYFWLQTLTMISHVIHLGGIGEIRDNVLMNR